MNTWQQHRRSKRREQMFQENIRYRQSLREVCRNEKNVERLCSEYAAKATEAERAGNHALAVRLAEQNANLRKHQFVSSGMRGSLEIAHAVQSSNQAMADILEGSRDAANSLLADAASPDVYATQAELESMKEHVQMFLHESGAFYDDLETMENEPVDEKGERYLKALLFSENKEKQRKLLRDTNSRLEKLQRNRSTEKEGGK